MKQYAVGTQESAQALLRECYKMTLPEPYDTLVPNRQVFACIPHCVDPDTYGWAVQFPEDTRRAIHWLSQIIARVAGDPERFSVDDKNFIREKLGTFDFASYVNLEGNRPYNDVRDLFSAIVNYWGQFQRLYPDDRDRARIQEKVSKQGKLALADLMPAWATELSSEAFFLDKWRPVNINALTATELASNRFPHVDASASQTITAERENGVYRGLSDLTSRVALPSEAIAMLEEAQAEGSLIFPG